MEPTLLRPTTIDDIALLAVPNDPQMSPNGTSIAYVVRTVDLEKNRYLSHIHVIGTAPDGEPGRQWTFGAEGEDRPRWSPDGKYLAFTSGREEKKGQIYLLPTAGGEARKVTNLPAGAIGGLIWSPDGNRIAFSFRPQDEDRQEKAAEERKKTNKSSPPREITRRHYREDGGGFVPSAPWDLHVLDIVTQAVSQITHGENGDQRSFCWSPDSSRLAVVRNTSPDPDLMPNASEIFVISASVESDSAGPHKVAAPLGPKYNVAWSPDGASIAYFGHDTPEEVWGVRNAHIWVAPIEPGVTAGAAARDLTPDWDVDCGNDAIGDMAGGGENGPFWAADGKSLTVLASSNGEVQIYKLAADPSAPAAPPQRLTSGTHAVTGFTGDAKRETFALLIATATDAGDIYTMPVGASFFRRLTRINEPLLSQWDITAPTAFRSDTGDVPCWAVLPPDWKENPTPRPTILYIHGGPHAMYASILFHEYHALAAAGYVVLYPNPRGSKGYGEAWTGAIRGNWGEPAQADCLACIDYAVEKGWSDPERLGVAGGSYGGYLTAWIIGHSDRFKAAVAERGVFNLHSMAGTCDFVWRDHDYFNSDTTADPGDYLRNSPLTYANAITTPTLIIHSEGDLRCPIEQAEQLFAALKLRGRDVVFLRYGPEASHGLSRGGPPDLRMDRQRRIHAYFDKYLKAGGDVPSTGSQGREHGG